MKAADYSAAFNYLKTADSLKVKKKHDTEIHTVITKVYILSFRFPRVI